MKMKAEKKKNLTAALLLPSIMAFFVFAAIGAYSSYSARPAYSYGYFNIGVGVAGPNFAFSIGNGVNAYYAPAFNAYIYGYNGYYYRWMGNYWVYSSAYPGQWYSLPPGFVVPPILIDGPPPPYFNYAPYFTWWTANVGPWWRVHYPRWWAMHGAHMGNFNGWRGHVNKYYHGNPGGRWRMAPGNPVSSRRVP